MNKNDILIHYGTPRHSGRYPWGSGENPYQHQIDFYSKVRKMKKDGLSDKEIQAALSKEYGHEVKSTEIRATMTVGRAAKRDEDRRRALYLKDQGHSTTEIGRIMGRNESSIRGLLDDSLAKRNTRVENTAEQLEKAVKDKEMIDIGKGTGLEIGVSNEHLNAAVNILKQKGYRVAVIQIDQATDPTKKTTMKVLVKEDVPTKYIYDNKEKIGSLTVYSPDLGRTFGEAKYPVSIKSDRVKVRYGDEGGKEKDGVIEIRPGVADLDMGGRHYAQVRIGVDDSHYLKGMAVYGDPKDFPKGVDIIFNTNKSSSKSKMDVLKPYKTDPRTGQVDRTNPFGALLRKKGQPDYIGPDGKEHQSALNFVKWEGDWAEQSRTVASQFLSKQNLQLIKKQLALSYTDYISEYDDLKDLTNPSIKKKMLESFADKCDKAAAHLKASSFPRQQVQVILPVSSLKDNEIYAPNYRDGETVALIRYPHAGPFEMPVLKVNNKNPEGRKVITNAAQDAVGINSKVAQVLSGADFDGDTVSVIPVNSRIKLVDSSNSEAVKVAKYLKGFDPQEAYPEVSGMKVMSKQNKQNQMGQVSNLITDMTIKGAAPEEVARAVKHSMVVIDSEKHKLNYQQSYIDNGIKALKIKYQGVSEKGQPKGASTIISKAKAKTYIPERSLRTAVDPETGKKIYFPTGKMIPDKKGNMRPKLQGVEAMSTVDDAFDLVSPTRHPKEIEYAKYANSLKSLANQARKEAYNIKPIDRNPSAAKLYAPEIESLDAKLKTALKNAPRERMAQRLADAQIKSTIKSFKEDPGMEDLSKEEIKKLRQQTIANARAQVGANRSSIKEITDREWKAIQSGAISKTKLDQIIRVMDDETLKKLATPRTSGTLPKSQQNRIKAMLASGWTQEEVAKAIGVSASTVGKVARGKYE